MIPTQCDSVHGCITKISIKYQYSKLYTIPHPFSYIEPTTIKFMQDSLIFGFGLGRLTSAWLV